MAGQVFQVLKCFECETYQVQQKKKVNKWRCKLCNARQSVVKVYGEGVASDCRKHVQKLNMSRATETISTNQSIAFADKPLFPQDGIETMTFSSVHHVNDIHSRDYTKGAESRGDSKWVAFLEEKPAGSSDDDEVGVASLYPRAAGTAGKRHHQSKSNRTSKKTRLTGSSDQTDETTPITDTVKMRSDDHTPKGSVVTEATRGNSTSKWDTFLPAGELQSSDEEDG